MQILIIEDEKLATDQIIRLLKNYSDQMVVAGLADGVKSSLDWLKSNPSPDLILCDIHLADGLSFEIFEQYDQNTPVVFITAYDRYAIQAFKLNSIDYILKPVSEEKLYAALKKYEHTQGAYHRMSRNLLSLLKEETQQLNVKKRFMVKSGEKIASIDVADIVFFFAKGKNTYLYSKNKSVHIIMYTLDQLEEILQASLFFRVNRQFILHFNYISEMVSYSSNRIKIELKSEFTSPEEIIVSKDRAQSFKEWLDQ